ncbi:hypothetical protein EF912_13310 [Streptomyces sp. WAC07061]|uniref:COG1470 family protein n=1 Tax=Streptomyces sp. WAC07061 TaxID=2487410 RepID=UPI000F7AEB95|nr:hypothetical protein [Streptomyces sp. WAC07061]RSS57746.1 hypothetical protein EF912_13310 [Streptomyces sp. WAC07061]
MPPIPARRGRRLLAAALLAAATLHAAPAAAAAGPATTAGPAAPAEPAGPATAAAPGWTAAPATAGPGAARPYFYLAGPAGTVLEDRLALDNPGDREYTVTLRGADADNAPDGALAVRPAAPGASGAGSWISFGGSATVRLPPRTRAVVPFTVTVPAAAPPGDHPAAVVAGGPGRETGVRIHLRVGGPAVAALTVEDVSVRGHGPATTVDYTLVNRGNVTLTPALGLRAEAALHEPAGRPARALPVELLPGRRARLSEPWPDAPALDRVALTLTATAPGAAPATAEAEAWLAPGGATGLAAGALLALAGTALAALLLVRARRTRRTATREAGKDTAAAEREPNPTKLTELTGAPR